MTKEQIKDLSGMIISEEQAEMIKENPDVINFECLGNSEWSYGYDLYLVEFQDGDNIVVDMKWKKKEKNFYKIY